MERRVTVLEVEVAHLTECQQELLQEVKAMREDLARYRGAWGAIVMIGAALVTAGSLALKFFKP